MDGVTHQGGQKKTSRSTSQPQKGLTYEEFLATGNPISREELPSVRSQISNTAHRIFNNWGTLESIVQRHEATIQKRWTKKSNSKRRELLLTTWPNMARDHRPDLDLEDSECLSVYKREVGWTTQGERRQLKLYEGSQREALLMPYINLHDLTKTEPLLLMINARARRSPHAFSSRDLQFSRQTLGLTDWRGLEGYVMDFDGPQSGPEAYGELRQEVWRGGIPTTGADPRLASGKLKPGDGLWLLEIQDRIYKFLLDTVLRILHDIPTGALTGPKYNIQPEPSLPSANSREDGVISLASTNLEAIYSSPGQIDLHRLQLLITSKANEEEDKLWAFREDPRHFSEGLEDYIAHRPQYVPDLLGNPHSATATDMRSPEERHSIGFLLYNFLSVESWASLAQEITSLVRLKEQHYDSGNVGSGDQLPQPFATALHKLEVILFLSIEHGISILRRTAHASPPLRPYIRRASPDTVDVFVYKPEKRPPQHIADFMLILGRICCSGCIQRDGHIARVQHLIEKYDKFINAVPDSHEAVSSCVAQEVSNLALLSECLRQIHLFRPWATSSDREMRSPHFQDALKAYLTNKQGETWPLVQLKVSARALSMCAAIAKSPYPVYRKRTAANVDAMQKTEALLDQMWTALLGEMEQQHSFTTQVKNVLFFQGRQLQRTPDWVEPVKPIKKTALQAPTTDALVQAFGGLKIDDKNKVQAFPIEKTKIKTRGTAAPQAPAAAQVLETEEEVQNPVLTIHVDRRALKVFSTLFHTPSSTSNPGEVPWTEFLHAMRSAGFGMEKLQGSAWQFTPNVDKDNNSRMGAGTRSIMFHEPHPHSRIPFWDARRHGRRLTRAYGWSGETFVAK